MKFDYDVIIIGGGHGAVKQLQQLQDMAHPLFS